MTANPNNPTDDIHIPKIHAGGIYELNLTDNQKNRYGNKKSSNYVANE